MADPRICNALTSGIGALTSLYRTETSRPEDVVAHCLKGIAARDGLINAFVHIDADAAHQAASASGRRWRQGIPLSALDGVPIAIKANIAVAGSPWTAGMRIYRNRIAARDASCVARLRANGAIIIGLTNMDEGGLGATTDNPWFGRTHNPLRHGYTAGGSSGGSAAAVAAGFCAAALGTDTIGSVRIPAAYCGVFGHKPTRGGISLNGVAPLSRTLDTVGFLTRSASDCALLSHALSDEIGRENSILAGRTIAIIDTTALTEIAPRVVEAYKATIDAARIEGAIIVSNAVAVFPFTRLQRFLLQLAEVEGAIIYERALRETPHDISPGLTGMLDWGSTHGDAYMVPVTTELEQIGSIGSAIMGECDAILLPTTPQTAFSFAKMPLPTNQAVFATFASWMGTPATAFPVAMDGDLPASIQVIARDESVCLSIAGALSVALNIGRHSDSTILG